MMDPRKWLIRKINHVRYQILARYKYLLSFRKKEWELSDYPVVYQRQSMKDIPFPAPAGYILPEWRAFIVNWGTVSGMGDTREQAYAQLEKRFADQKARPKPMPRPGRGRPAGRASAEVIKQYESIARDFLPRILDLDFDECFISDRSRLSDFEWLGDTLQHLTQKVTLVYRIDLRDVPNPYLVEIFKRIQARREMEDSSPGESPESLKS